MQEEEVLVEGNEREGERVRDREKEAYLIPLPLLADLLLLHHVRRPSVDAALHRLGQTRWAEYAVERGEAVCSS